MAQRKSSRVRMRPKEFRSCYILKRLKVVGKELLLKLL